MPHWKDKPRPRGPHPGKTDKRRPADEDKYRENHDRIFRKDETDE